MQTRATLIAVGREHFLRYGLGGAVAEKIAEDAGYSRGALYSNFDGKEDLFPCCDPRGTGRPDGDLSLHFQRRAFSQRTPKKDAGGNRRPLYGP